MLTSLLPGLRELRAPLAAGYLWLTVAWLIFGDNLNKAAGDQNSPIASLSKLHDDLGPTATLAALTFVAYLLGCAVGTPNPPAILDEAINRPAPDLKFQPIDHGDSVSALSPERLWWRLRNYLRPPLSNAVAGPALQQEIYELAFTAQSRGIEVYDVLESPDVPHQVRSQLAHFDEHSPSRMGHQESPDERSGRELEILQRVLVDAVLIELPALVNRLHIERPALFETYDRLRAESEFRISSALPLAAIIVTLAFRFGEPAVILALVLPVVIYLQGWMRKYSAEAVIWEALTQGLIRSTALKSIAGLGSNRGP